MSVHYACNIWSRKIIVSLLENWEGDTWTAGENCPLRLSIKKSFDPQDKNTGLEGKWRLGMVQFCKQSECYSPRGLKFTRTGRKGAGWCQDEGCPAQVGQGLSHSQSACLQGLCTISHVLLYFTWHSVMWAQLHFSQGKQWGFSWTSSVNFHIQPGPVGLSPLCLWLSGIKFNLVHILLPKLPQTLWPWHLFPVAMRACADVGGICRRHISSQWWRPRQQLLFSRNGRFKSWLAKKCQNKTKVLKTVSGAVWLPEGPRPSVLFTQLRATISLAKTHCPCSFRLPFFPFLNFLACFCFCLGNTSGGVNGLFLALHLGMTLGGIQRTTGKVENENALDTYKAEVISTCTIQPCSCIFSAYYQNRVTNSRIILS